MSLELIPLEKVSFPDKQKKKLTRDKGQIEKMRKEIESGKELLPITVYLHQDGKYKITDGRHRFVAHCLAETGSILAEITH